MLGFAKVAAEEDEALAEACMLLKRTTGAECLAAGIEPPSKPELDLAPKTPAEGASPAATMTQEERAEGVNQL
jgi:hypothetical protein